MVAILQLKASKHFVYFVSITVVTFTLLDIILEYLISVFLENILYYMILHYTSQYNIYLLKMIGRSRKHAH